MTRVQVSSGNYFELMPNRKIRIESIEDQESRLEQEADAIWKEQMKRSKTGCTGPVSKSVHERASLGYLLALVFADSGFEIYHKDLKAFAASEHALIENASKLADQLGPYAASLNLEPVFLAHCIISWGNEGHEFPLEVTGSDDWYRLSKEILDGRQALLDQLESTYSDMRFALIRLNQDPRWCLELVSRKLRHLRVNVDRLADSVRREWGPQKRMFYSCTKTQLKLFLLLKMKRLKSTSKAVIEALSEMDEIFDLSIKEDRMRLAKWAHDGADQVQRLVDRILARHGLQLQKRRYTKR